MKWNKQEQNKSNEDKEILSIWYRIIWWTKFFCEAWNKTESISCKHKKNQNPKLRPKPIGYYSFALSTFALVKYGKFALKITHLPLDFGHICSKNVTFAPLKKGPFALNTKKYF